MADDEKEKPKKKDAAITQAYAKTRKSLIARLDNWEDQKTWDEFYQTYWRLIYSVAIKAGLRPEEALRLRAGNDPFHRQAEQEEAL